MTISELKILIDLNKDHVKDVLNRYCEYYQSKYFFVDYEDGICYLFDEHGNELDISNAKYIHNLMISKDIKKIVIPDSVEIIRYAAFFGCKSLKSISIPDSVKSIRAEVFYRCESLKTISIPNSVKSIGNDTFSYCTSLTSLTIPDSVKSIGDYTFFYCTALKNIIIPDSVKDIGNGAFSDCDSLKEVIFEGKTIEEVKNMKYYPFGIKDESIIKCN